MSDLVDDLRLRARVLHQINSDWDDKHLHEYAADRIEELERAINDALPWIPADGRAALYLSAVLAGRKE